MNRTLEHRDPNKLKIHPRNAPLYGNTADYEFIEDIKKNGVTVPLLITKDSLVLGGHRRRQAALYLKLSKVPVYVVQDDLSDAEALSLLLADNRYREKSNEVKAREFELLKLVEEDLAKQREKKGQFGKKTAVAAENTGTSNLTDPVSEPGEAAEKAAKEVGMSKNTAKKAAEVVHAIDEAEEAGETEKAEHLRETLNKSVSAAHKEVTETKEPAKDEAGNPIPKSLEETFAARAEFKSLMTKVSSIKTGVKSLIDDGFSLSMNKVQKDVGNLRNEIRFSAPYAVCCYCKGKGGKCDACKGRAWLTELQWKNVPGDMK